MYRLNSRLMFLFLIIAAQIFPQQIKSKSVSGETEIGGLFKSPYFNEQVVTFNYAPDIRIQINAPSVTAFDPSKPVCIALFALPNGNTIEQTVGKILETGDDWHYDIQHIGAQTRFIRENVTDYNLVTVYLETAQKSWPSWNSKYANHSAIIKKIAEYMMGIFKDYNPYIVLTGHSGGGRFTFSFIDAFDEIPSYVKRISFLDSDYGYETSYRDKIANWINASDDHYLSVIAYNDSVALYNGEPIVSPTGGTWYRSKLMKKDLSSFFNFTDEEDDQFIKYNALNGRIKFILKKNPERAILHTVQVERNGFIQGMVSGTQYEGAGYEYYGSRTVYSKWIQINVEHPALPSIPPRNPSSMTGSEFMQSVANLSFADREDRIYNEISTGNMPDFLRKLKEIEVNFNDASGASHSVKYKVMPDYLAIGSDEDFCRIPMGPITAQKLADLFGMVMPTRKLVDNIYSNCEIKLEPVTYTPIGNQNELVSKFVEHNAAIEQERITAGGTLGQLTGGTKKDVVLSNKITDPSRPDHVVIYGWHWLSGQPIQPLTNIHINTYVDYSHGIRFLNGEIWLDGKVVKIIDILTDSNLYKILSDESGVMYQPSYISKATGPEQPRSFGVIPEGEKTLRVFVKPDPTVSQYEVYLSKDGVNFNPPVKFNPGEILLKNLPTDIVAYIKIKAVNQVGTSPESEVLAGIATDGSMPSAIIINGFDRSSDGNTYNFVRQHASAFHANGVPFVSATNDAVVDGLIDLKDYKIADYILGDESTVDETFSSSEQTLAASFLKQGGCLFVSGSEIAWDLDYKGSATDKTFINNYLKMKYVDDAPGGTSGAHYSVDAQSGNIFDGIQQFNFDNGTHGTINVKWPDFVTGDNGGESCLLYTGFDASEGCAAVNYSGIFPGGSKEGKVVAFGFPFETIYPEDVRINLMGKILNYFDAATSVNDGEQEGVIKDYRLYQNFPNPFNPTTVIRYRIASQSHVLLKVYDLLGKEVKMLVDENMAPGIYNVVFNAGGMASGVYLYKLEAGGYTSTKKLMVLK